MMKLDHEDSRKMIKILVDCTSKGKWMKGWYGGKKVFVWLVEPFTMHTLLYVTILYIRCCLCQEVFIYCGFLIKQLALKFLSTVARAAEATALCVMRIAILRKINSFGQLTAYEFANKCYLLCLLYDVLGKLQLPCSPWLLRKFLLSLMVSRQITEKSWIKKFRLDEALNKKIGTTDETK